MSGADLRSRAVQLIRDLMASGPRAPLDQMSELIRLGRADGSVRDEVMGATIALFRRRAYDSYAACWLGLVVGDHGFVQYTASSRVVPFGKKAKRVLLDYIEHGRPKLLRGKEQNAAFLGRRFLSWALIHGHILQDLASLIAVQPRETLPRTLNEAEVEALVERGARDARERCRPRGPLASSSG